MTLLNSGGMNPGNIPFNVLVVGSTNSGKSKFVVDQLYAPFCGKFDYIVLICPTSAHNKTFRRLGEKDPRMVVMICEQHEVEKWLMVRGICWRAPTRSSSMTTAASKDVKGRTGELVSLAFSARHIFLNLLQY